MINSILGKIRATRELKNISQQVIANDLDITQSSYAKMERGYTKMNLENLIKITKYLEIDISQLFNREKQKGSSAISTTNIENQQLENLILLFQSQQQDEIVELKKVILSLKESLDI